VTNSGHVTTSYRRRYPQSSRAVGQARRDIVEFARGCGFLGQSLDDIEVAVGEGLANAVEHAHRSDGGFEVAVVRDAESLIVEIKDGGRGFDHGRAAPPARPPVEALRGFGMFIMRELMDDVRYSERGTRLQLVKRLPCANAERRPMY
jgi:anti-sigma regulatory factor (Ser/Thr protein kinase)